MLKVSPKVLAPTLLLVVLFVALYLVTGDQQYLAAAALALAGGGGAGAVAPPAPLVSQAEVNRISRERRGPGR